jgi:hypothetical protein
MPRTEAVAPIVLALALLFPLHASAAPAQDAGPRAQDAGPSARDGGARPSAAPASSAASDDDGALPVGHPPVDDANPHARAGAASGGMPGTFEPPEDVEQPDPTLPPGTIVVDLHDGDDKPVPNEMLTLGVLINSIAKGDSRKHLQATTDEHGRAVFSGLELAGNIAYRVSAGYQGGAFAAAPFQLQQAKAMHVVLHVYPVTRDIQKALIVAEATIACEVREDRIQVEQVLTIYNLGRIAWQPDDVRMKLPSGFTAFNAQATMSDQGVDEVTGSAQLRGTFPPGRHPLEFRWQVPWSGDADVDFQVALPPHVAIARVMMAATSDVKLVAEGFPPAEIRHDQQGQSFLVTERRLRPDDPKLTSLGVGIHDLPTPGPGKWLATLLAACGVVAGLVLALSGRGRTSVRGEAKSNRASILEELAEVERGRASGEIGPKTYERLHRQLIDALARTLVKT